MRARSLEGQQLGRDGKGRGRGGAELKGEIG